MGRENVYRDEILYKTFCSNSYIQINDIQEEIQIHRMYFLLDYPVYIHM